MEVSAAQGYPSSPQALAPYPPAGFSRFLAWVDRLPLHGWWVFPVLVFVQLVWSQGVLWAAGHLPVGTFDPVIGYGAVYGPYTLAAIAYLNGVARRSLRDFWPGTGWPDGERPGWEYRFVTSPGGYGPRILVVGLLLALGGFLASPTTIVAGDASGRITLLAAYLPTLLFGYSMFVIALIHVGRQLRLVSRIHRDARAIDPFDTAPLYAFSRLTMQTGVAYLLVGYFSLTANGAWQFGNFVSLFTVFVAFGAGVLAFVAPLWGIHGRLVREKEALARDAEHRLNRLGAEMYSRIDAGAFDSTKTIAESLDGVRAMRERIVRLPTWPWPPQVLRGFVSALFLPVVVYVISRIVASGVGT